jgi:hypothetical protein
MLEEKKIPDAMKKSGILKPNKNTLMYSSAG